MDLAGSETSGMRENTVCGTREALSLAWHILPGPHGEPEGHDRDVRGQRVGQLHSTEEAFEQRLPRGPAEEVEGRELAKGNAAEHTRGRTQGRVPPVTGARPRTAGTFGCLRVITRGRSPVR
jgi:hypothetical protein